MLSFFVDFTFDARRRDLRKGLVFLRRRSGFQVSIAEQDHPYHPSSSCFLPCPPHRLVLMMAGVRCVLSAPIPSWN